MADEAEVTGEVHERATGRGFLIRKLLEKEEVEGNSVPASARPGRARAARSMAGGHGARRSSRKAALESTATLGRKPKR